MEIRFDQINEEVPTDPGYYEIYTTKGTLLKVGIAKNLKKRLMQHARSKQSALKTVHRADESCPKIFLSKDIESKQSILAKHLFFDSKITNDYADRGYNLKTEVGRCSFLNECCRLKFTVTESREEAKINEKRLGASGKYRYVGKVVQR
ncbi:hypothetical protein [Microbulbifer sp. TRSA007]|uniref:hypothetical protein n=1 Tax=unclassified Microbulbifer TaxID=2619833 RepID=UPI004039C040